MPVVTGDRLCVKCCLVRQPVHIMRQSRKLLVEFRTPSVGAKWTVYELAVQNFLMDAHRDGL